MKNNDLLPCEVNAQITCVTCNLHNKDCPIETVCGAKGAYEIVKAFNPVQTKSKAGVNVQELVKSEFPKLYKKLRLKDFDWQNDLNGVLDFLYGERELGIMCLMFGISKSEISSLIAYIENNCVVKYG